MLENRKYSHTCEVCGEKTFWVCTMCDSGIHYFYKKGPGVGKLCFLEYNNETFFGLSRCGMGMYRLQRKAWNPPRSNQKTVHALHIRSFQNKNKN